MASSSLRTPRSLERTTGNISLRLAQSSSLDLVSSFLPSTASSSSHFSQPRSAWWYPSYRRGLPRRTGAAHVIIVMFSLRSIRSIINFSSKVSSRTDGQLDGLNCRHATMAGYLHAVVEIHPSIRLTHRVRGLAACLILNNVPQVQKPGHQRANPVM